MPCCAVKGCVSYDKKHKKSTDGITYHRFPSDPVRHEAWSRVIRRERGEPYFKASGYSRICSKHFKEDDFYMPGSRRMLKKTAIPNVNVEELYTEQTDYDTIRKKTEKDATVPSQEYLKEKEYSTVIVKIEPGETDYPQDDLKEKYQNTVIVKIEPDETVETQYNINEKDYDTSIVKIETDASEDSQAHLNEKDTAIEQIETDTTVAPKNYLKERVFTTTMVKIEAHAIADSEDDLKDVDISDLQPVLETPFEVALKRKLDKFMSLNSSKSKKIKVLQRQNNRLMIRNKSLISIIKELNRKGLISTEIESVLGETAELKTIYKLIR